MRLLNGLHAYGTGHRPAVSVNGRGLSAQRLRNAANAVAADVHGAATVAVDATASLETVVAVTGALLAGSAVVPVPADAGPAEREHILRDSGAAVTLSNRLPGATPVDPDRTAQFAGPAPAPDDVALVMYTSGTTGAPKGVELTHGAVEAGLDALADAWAWTPEDRLVHGLPLFHVHGLILGVLGALRVGSPLVHTGRPTPAAYAAARGTLYFGVPTVWSRVCAEPAAARALRPARLLVSGSAPLPAPVFERLYALTGHRPVERYGMTETLITISSRFDGERRPGQVGTPVAGVATRLLAEDGTEAPRDGETIGELLVKGPMLLRRYRGQPADSARTPDGWFRTGDLARIAPDGWHRIVGRASTDLIKSGGYRIGAGEVEDALLAHPAVREAAVVGVPHEDLGEVVTAYVVAAPGVGERELIDFVAAHLNVHKRPRAVHFLDALPRNAMGKVQKKRLGGPML
ncbi:AMP-binding protein [Dactylosporangium matsuzakiense]|uniref:Acyl-CoA synthetase n=1 Tax=Dactylosporangium matsuzakiense TaxID=53360 RepID=A0A9W6KXP5_9ACTN|nr:AMP-binding protein [Dactylosporangium matsuzakiense]UWZ41688.1 AMP-binding protein [Dactylosporangium matsuzakiense]GLL07374.1 acyl-CoA synthetase [Dactylosporangium matsuzakiense]